MNTVGCAIALLVGTAVGLFVLGRYPSGLDPSYGICLICLGVLAGLLALLWRRERRVLWGGLLLMFALAGTGKALIVHVPVTSANLAYYNSEQDGDRVEVRGVVAGEPVPTDRAQRLRLKAETIRLPGNATPKRVTGDMYATVARYPAFSFGERLVLSGVLTDPPQFSGFDYRAYLARQGIYSYMTFPRVKAEGRAEELSIFNMPVRQRVSLAIRQALPEPQAALTVGVVTGDRSSIPTGVQDAFQRSGTTHILAISGQNISLLVGFAWMLYGRKGRGMRMPLWLVGGLLLSLVSYTLFTGATPSVVRAAVMGAVLLLAPIAGRRYDATSAITVSAALMALFDPRVVADGGFQLSFLATVGITYLAPNLHTLLTSVRMPAALSLPLATSLAAQAATLPLAALLTGRVSLVSVGATLTADFVLLPLMITGIITGIAGTLWLPLGQLAGLAVWPFASWMLYAVQLWAALPWASVELHGLNEAYVLAYYAGGVGLTWLLSTANSGRAWSAHLQPRGTLALAACAVVAFSIVVGLLFS
ncbi:MAG TPA: ComEC/Rec2 family competence protein [Chloroflexia bacterium]|nr:ComEC/Rec2 family competence protein [Chloroflexia bacterium]